MRAHPSILTLLLGGAALMGCTIVVPPPQPPHPPEGPPAQAPKGAANGKPVGGVKPGQGVGIWIWRQNDNHWIVRGVTEGKLHKFRGTVGGASGAAVSWHEPQWMEIGDGIAPYNDTGLVFYYEVGGHLDQFQFTLADGGCARFHITADERPDPKRIFLGANGVNPPSDHFVVCP